MHGVTADTSPDRFNTIELDGFLGPNYVITYHHDTFRSITNVKKQLTTSPVTCQRGPAFLMHQILDQIVDYYSPVLDDFDERIDQLEDNIFSLKRPNDSILEQIMELKRSVLRLRRISSKQMDIFYRMSRGEVHLIPQPMLPFYRDIYDHLIRVTDLAENYRDLISGALGSLSLSRLKPHERDYEGAHDLFRDHAALTFIAGLYGMNFDNLPELHWAYSYFVVLGLMLIVALGMLYMFWRRGWIGAGPRKSASDQRVINRL